MSFRPYWALFDVDDTLGGIEHEGEVCGTSQAYDLVIQKFAAYMQVLGVSPEAAVAKQQEIDADLCRRHGFADMGRFPQSFRLAYAHLLGQDANSPQADEVEKLGWLVFQFPYRSLPGAIDTLAVVSKQYRVALVTKGNDEEQRKKVFEMGLWPYADQIFVLPHKSFEEWENVIQILRLDMPKRLKSWAIGNSIKSDINPPLELGLNAIHIPRGDWAFEREPYATPQPHAKLLIEDTVGGVLKHLTFS